MPAPSSMLSRPSVPVSSSHENRNDSSNQRTTLDGYQQENSSSTAQRTVIDNIGAMNSTLGRRFDNVFISRPIKESKNMLWEIKDFNRICHDKVERAMSFEFEMGRLGTIERHLPRRSRWKVILDMEDTGGSRIPAIRVLQLSPENKIIFYQLDACILEINGEAHPYKETSFRTPYNGYKEALLNDTRSYENVFPIQSESSCGDASVLDQIQEYVFEGSLFIKVEIEILEEASS